MSRDYRLYLDDMLAAGEKVLRYPDVPWAEIVGFRNIVVHHYFRVDETIVWRIVESQLSLLIEQVREILEREDSGE